MHYARGCVFYPIIQATKMIARTPVFSIINIMAGSWVLILVGISLDLDIAFIGWMTCSLIVPIYDYHQLAPYIYIFHENALPIGGEYEAIGLYGVMYVFIRYVCTTKTCRMRPINLLYLHPNPQIQRQNSSFDSSLISFAEY